MLLTIVAVIAVTKTRLPSRSRRRIPDPLHRGDAGRDESRYDALLKAGRKSLPGMAAVRAKLKGQPREKLFLRPHVGDPGRSVRQDAEAKKLPRASRASRSISPSRIRGSRTSVVHAEFSNTNLVLDPALDAGHVEKLEVQGKASAYALEILCAVKDLDFDVKYGVIFISKPMRIGRRIPRSACPTRISGRPRRWARPTPKSPRSSGRFGSRSTCWTRHSALFRITSTRSASSR
jgi:hypothetical protein